MKNNYEHVLPVYDVYALIDNIQTQLNVMENQIKAVKYTDKEKLEIVEKRINRIRQIIFDF